MMMNLSDGPGSGMGLFTQGLSLNSCHLQQRAAVGIGVNLGDREAHMQAAAQMLLALPDCDDFKFSAIYETAAVDCPEPLPFLNAAVSFNTSLSPKDLLDALLAAETRRGRIRSYRNAPRVLDLDLLLHGDTVCAGERLTLPHPRLHQRMFVLTPLMEVWGDQPLPVLGAAVGTLVGRLQAGEADVMTMSQFQWK